MCNRIYNVIIIDDEPMARERIDDLLKNEPDMEVAAHCRNGIEAVESIKNLKPDLIFLDVQMPGLNGLEVLAQLDQENFPETIFVTAYDKYTLQAFSAHALDYLLKPYDDDRFKEALDYARKRMKQENDNPPQTSDLLAFIKKLDQKDSYIKRIQVKLNQRIILINVDNIDSIEAEGSYVRIHSGGADYLLRESLNSLEKKLDPRQFTRLHRSTIVNIDSIKELQHWSQNEWLALLVNGRKYVVSRGYREKLKNIL